jgi:glucose dehydrogenase
LRIAWILRTGELGQGVKDWSRSAFEATPMSYSIDGRQYLVIAAGGYKGDSTRGDYLVAYALPR